MTRRRDLVRAAAAVAAALLLAPMATAQPAREKGEKELAKTAAKPDPAVEAWVKILGEKMTDRHDDVRDSARAAIVTIGKPALPVLQKLAESDDGATATAAKKMIERIERRDRRPPQFGRSPRDPGMRGGPGGPRPMPRGGFGAAGSGGFGGGFGPAQGFGGAAIGGFPQGGMQRGFGGGGGGGFGPPGGGFQQGGMQRGAGGFGPPGGGQQLPMPANRQQGGPPAGFAGGGGVAPPGSMLLILLRDLDLSEKQREQVNTIIESSVKKRRDEMAKLREKSERPDIETLRASAQKFRDDFVKQVKPLLTDEQKKKLDQAVERTQFMGPPARPKEE